MKKLIGKIEDIQFAAITVEKEVGIEYGLYIKFDFGKNGKCDFSNYRSGLDVDKKDEDDVTLFHLAALTMAQLLEASKIQSLEHLKDVFIIGYFNDENKLISIQFGLDEDAKEVLL